MDLNFSTEEHAFRDEVRSFLSEKLPKSYAQKVAQGVALTKAEMEDWHSILNTQGWLVYHWPKAWGGCDWGPVKAHIFQDELAAADAPRVLPFGFTMLAPVLFKFGSDAQRNHWLPRMVKGEDWWCQGYSEPGSGSDLASLRTTAERDGDHYVVNGQKTWTTLGQYANMIFCLVRTSSEGKQQEGISFLLVDMSDPGVEVRPIQTIDGGYEVNDVFLTDVRVPVENLVGEENKGWTYAKYLLTHERVGIADVGGSQNKLERLKVLAKQQKRNGRPLAEDPLFAARIARVEIALRNMATTNLRVLSAAAKGEAPGPESSMLKIQGSEVTQELDSLNRRALGRHAQAWTPEIFAPGYNGPTPAPPEAANNSARYFNNRKISIYGGSNEIQKNIITKMILGL